MATAEERRRLHDRLEEAIGAGSAGTMIDMLAEMATKDDVAALATRADLDAAIEVLETRILARFDREAARFAEELTSVREESMSIRVEMAAQFASVRQDAAAQSAAVRQDIASLALSGWTMLFGVAAILVAQVAAVAAVAALG